MAESAYAADLKSADRKVVGVQVPPRPPEHMKIDITDPNNLKILDDYKKEKFALRDVIWKDVGGKLFSSLEQSRGLIQNIAIISGAISAFTIQALGSPVIETPVLAYLSLYLNFSVIVYAVFHLGFVFTKEINGLTEQLHTYIDINNEDIDRINKAIQTGEIDNLRNFNMEDIEQRLKKLESKKEKPDNSIDVLTRLLLLALVAFAISVIPIPHN